MYKFMCIYTYIVHFFVTSLALRQCQWDTSCRSRREPSNGIVASDFRFPYSKGVILHGELARAGWGDQVKRELGEPKGATAWTLHINKNSKNPFEPSSDREKAYS